MEDTISQIGYAVIFVGCFLEGDIILFLGALAAPFGFFYHPIVLIMAFAGRFGGDQYLFFKGLDRGQEYLEKHPRVRRTAL